jgi:hypothetical protein
MRHHDRAIDELLRTFISPEAGLAESLKKGEATFAQITGHRRRPEEIVIDMLDNRSRTQPVQLKRIRGPHRRAAKRMKAQRMDP